MAMRGKPLARAAEDRAIVSGAPARPSRPTRRTRTRDLIAAKQRGDRWPMLTSYDQYTASIFDRNGVPVLLVGDSAANNVFGYETTLPITVDELLPLVRAVVRAVRERDDLVPALVPSSGGLLLAARGRR